MEPEKPLSFIYHEHSKKIGRLFSADSDTWPLSWKTIEYKTYERLPKIQLPRQALTYNLSDALKKRTSKRSFSQQTLSLNEIGQLLEHAVGTSPREGETAENAQHRAYPSGGALYPTEIYVLVRRGSESLKAGLYHYNFKDHSLSVLYEGTFANASDTGFLKYPWADHAPVVIFMTSIFERQYQKYGERSYRFALLEAGHISQNIYLVSEALGIKCCAIGGIKGGDQVAEKILDIDGYYESLVHIMVLGK